MFEDLDATKGSWHVEDSSPLVVQMLFFFTVTYLGMCLQDIPTNQKEAFLKSMEDDFQNLLAKGHPKLTQEDLNNISIAWQRMKFAFQHGS